MRDCCEATRSVRPLLGGVSAERVRDRESAAELLDAQTGRMIRWSECLNTIAEARIDVMPEVGPVMSFRAG
jgi:malonyl CoA-acyl carrier protein transacylase